MRVPPLAADLFRAVAPVLGTALGGPLGGTVAAVAAKALDQWVEPRQPGEKVTPEAIVEVVEANADNPAMALDLKRAELAVKDYELRMKKLDAEFDLLKLEQRDRADARQTMTALVSAGSHLGWVPASLSILIVAGFFGVLGLLIFHPFEVSQGQRDALLIMLGALVAGFAEVRAFWLGSSVSSRTQNAALVNQAENAVNALGVAARERPEAPAVPPAPVIVQAPAPRMDPPSIQEGPWHQGPHGGRRWRLTPGGVVPEGEASPMRTVGQPATVRRIWRDFGPLVAASCARNGVPLELAVACIAVESRGRAADVREEPGYVSDHETPHKVSVGLMQTLLSTASEAMGRTVARQDLLDPATSIEAGVRYMAKQRPKTQYQPPLAAAAYNAGGLYPPREGDDNPWRLRSTGDHVSRFCQFMGDACFVAAEEGWGHTAERAA